MFARYLAGCLLSLLLSIAAGAQVPGALPGTIPSGAPQTPSQFKIIPSATPPTISPGALKLLELEIDFAKSVAEGGGKAFASWFADDAVALSNGQPAELGRGAIAASANWSPKDYSLTWNAEGAQMGPSNDMGFTWGHYEGRSKNANGHEVVTTGRYITIWRKLANGSWKVAMDASANEPANACCAPPTP
jgi:ketosteroid isomerase-like protein